MKSSKIINIAACLALLLFTVSGTSTLVEHPAEMQIRQTLLGKFKIYATAKVGNLPNEVDQISVMLYGEEGQNFRRDNVFCPCGTECEVDPVTLPEQKTLVGVWDRRLDNCEKAPRGDYSVTLVGPVEQDGKVLPVVYAHASISIR